MRIDSEIASIKSNLMTPLDNTRFLANSSNEDGFWLHALTMHLENEEFRIYVSLDYTWAMLLTWQKIENFIMLIW